MATSRYLMISSLLLHLLTLPLLSVVPVASQPTQPLPPTHAPTTTTTTDNHEVIATFVFDNHIYNYYIRANDEYNQVSYSFARNQTFCNVHGHLADLTTQAE